MLTLRFFVVESVVVAFLTQLNTLRVTRYNMHPYLYM